MKTRKTENLIAEIQRMYNEETMKKGLELHRQSAVCDAWDLTFEEIAAAYATKHDAEYFLEQMEQRSIYYDLADLDNMSIMEHHYPEKYQEWLKFQPE